MATYHRCDRCGCEVATPEEARKSHKTGVPGVIGKGAFSNPSNGHKIEITTIDTKNNTHNLDFCLSCICDIIYGREMVLPAKICDGVRI